MRKFTKTTWATKPEKSPSKASKLLNDTTSPTASRNRLKTHAIRAEGGVTPPPLSSDVLPYLAIITSFVVIKRSLVGIKFGFDAYLTLLIVYSGDGRLTCTNVQMLMYNVTGAVSLRRTRFRLKSLRDCGLVVMSTGQHPLYSVSDYGKGLLSSSVTQEDFRALSSLVSSLMA